MGGKSNSAGFANANASQKNTSLEKGMKLSHIGIRPLLNSTADSTTTHSGVCEREREY